MSGSLLRRSVWMNLARGDCGIEPLKPLGGWTTRYQSIRTVADEGSRLGPQQSVMFGPER